MSKFLGAILLGAVSILLLAGLGVTQSPTPPRLAASLPAIAADAVRAETPRECSNEQGITTDCIY